MENNEISDFYKQQKIDTLKNYNLAVYHTRAALFFAGGLTLIPVFISFSLQKNIDTLGFVLPALIFCTFIGLSIFSKQKPHTALIIGAIVYCIYICLLTIPYIYTYGAFGFLKGLYHGALFKILVLTILGKPAAKAKYMQNANEDLGNI